MESCSLAAFAPTWDDLKTVIGVLCGIVTLASAITAVTPTPPPGSRLAKVYRVIEVLALVVGKAKDTGTLPPVPPQLDKPLQEAVDIAKAVRERQL